MKPPIKMKRNAIKRSLNESKITEENFILLLLVKAAETNPPAIAPMK